MEQGQDHHSQEADEVPKKRTPEKSSLKAGKSTKKSGEKRDNITLGGLRKVEKAAKRKEKQRINKKLGDLQFQTMKKQQEKRKSGPPPSTRSVMFIDNTAGGKLVKRMQNVELEVGETTDLRVRMAEAAGTPLSMLLPSTNLWGPSDCGRDDCVTCGQGDERRIDCRKRNILYESRCDLCNKEEVGSKRKELEELKSGRGIYVGESSRSIYERSKEHQADKEARSEESHQIKHWLTDHQDLMTPPTFKFRIIQTFQDPMTRQLAEAVRIELRGAGVLNSKAEYNRIRVPRLRVDLEGWRKAKEQEVSIQREGEQGNEVEEDLQERDLKRKSNKDNNVRKTKRRKMERLVGWGENSSHQGEYDEFNSLRSTDNLPDDWRGTGSSERVDHTPTVGAEMQDHAPTTTNSTDIRLAWGGTGKHAPTGGAAGRGDISVTDHALEMIEVIP